jgi:hypothetical protein
LVLCAHYAEGRPNRRADCVAPETGRVPHPVSWTLSEGRLVIAGSLTAVV